MFEILVYFPTSVGLYVVKFSLNYKNASLEYLNQTNISDTLHTYNGTITGIQNNKDTYNEATIGIQHNQDNLKVISAVTHKAMYTI